MKPEPGSGDNVSAPLAIPPEHPRKIVYLGTPQIAVPPLLALLESGFEITRVITGEPKRRGRGNALSPSPVHQCAMDHGISVAHRAKDALGANADLGVVVAFGRIIRPAVLEQLPMVNLHFSLLPRWRGAAPVERAIMAGDPMTGVCVMGVDVGLDTGAVYATEAVAIRPEHSADELSAELSHLGARLLVDTLRGGLSNPVDQVGEATYAAKLGSEDFEVRFDRVADEMAWASRVAPLWTTFRGRRFRLHRVESVPGQGPAGQLDGDVLWLNDGGLRLIDVQIEGKGRQSFADWRNGARPEASERFGAPPNKDRGA